MGVSFLSIVLLTREEMTFDFAGARFRTPAAAPLNEGEATVHAGDVEFLTWAFNQFLYGEVTGIQCGHWLYNAPDLPAARFLAKQALEEFQHVENFVRILHFLGARPAKPHRLVRFLSTGMMPDDWAEHVSLEMAQGEGMVLIAFYALIDTVDDDRITRILKGAVVQEESHVRFGEERTMELIRERPALRRRLLGLNLVSLAAVKRLGKYLQKRANPEHPVFSRAHEFTEHVVRTCEVRLQRMGLLQGEAARLSWFRKLLLVGEAYGYNFLKSVVRFPLKFLPFGAPKRLTDTYLADPGVAGLLRKLDETRAPG